MRTHDMDDKTLGFITVSALGLGCLAIVLKLAFWVFIGFVIWKLLLHFGVV